MWHVTCIYLLGHQFYYLIAEIKMNQFNELKEFKTLLVDDDEFIRDSLSLVFSKQRCFMQAAETAEEGLQAIKAERFDIIISDLRLPGRGGLEFLKEVKNAQPETLCILITAYRDIHVASQASAIGIHDCIEKPFSIEVLIQALSRLIKSRRKN